MKPLLFFLILPAFLIGCGSTTLVTTPAQFAEINENVQGYTSTLSVGGRLGESVFKGDSVRIQPDSTFWFEPDKNVWRSVATPALVRVKITMREVPALKFALVTLGIVGLLEVLTSPDALGSILIQALGAATIAIGAPIIAISGTTHEYFFQIPNEVKMHQSPPTSSEPPKTNRE